MAALSEALKSAWDAIRAIEPARGKVTEAQVREVRDLIDQISVERIKRDGAGESADDRVQLEDAAAVVYARAAAVAIAAGEEANAARWLATAGSLNHDEDLRDELAAAGGAHERYRALVHGRSLFAAQRESAARTIWAQLAKGEADALARAATAELKAPRALRQGQSMPTLSRINGIGAGFYGRRDVWPDGSYATTHCISVVWIPLFALSAWRVMDDDGGYRIFAREQLSAFARWSRWVVLGAIALVVSGYALHAYFNDPERLARLRWDEAIETASHSKPEAALQLLDGELARDVDDVDHERAEQAGAEVVRLSAGYLAAPLVPDKVDQAIRVVRRYQALPDRARAGAASEALFATVDRWIAELGAGSPAAAEAQLALMSAASEHTSGARRDSLDQRIAAARIALAATKRDDWPLEALAILVGDSGPINAQATATAAGEIVAQLAAVPSLLVDAGSDLDAALGLLAATERTRITGLRDASAAGRAEAEAEDVTPTQLAAMQTKRPGDQYVAVRLADLDAAAGKVDAAAARLAKLGPPGRTVRAARLLRAQLAAGQGQLDDADAQLTALLGNRALRFGAASAALEEAGKAAQSRIERALETGNVPEDLKRRYHAASEAERGELIRGWMEEQMKGDAALAAARSRYVALGDVVPTALAAGSVKLRRAQAMSGTARERMLEDAERTFLAIRSEAEGQPSFRLVLGEIYARLGKTTESDAELDAVLARNEPALSLQVAGVYRNVGSLGRAKQLAKQVFERGNTDIKESAALMLAVMLGDSEGAEESEQWYRRANQKIPMVQASLLSMEARRLGLAGKDAACAAKYVEAATVHLSTASRLASGGYNNAALEYQHAYDCSGDLKILRDAERTLETAYRNAPDEPIVLDNLGSLLLSIGELRVLSRHVDARALRLRLSDTGALLDELIASAEGDAVIAELRAEPSLRRSSELLSQVEVLRPNDPSSYLSRFSVLARQRDVDAAAAVVDRARRAKAIDASDLIASRKRWASGGDDASWIAKLEVSRDRLAAVLAGPGRLDARTRAAGWLLTARTLGYLGRIKADAAILRQAREAAAKATQLWPVLDGESRIVTSLIDEAGFAADAKGWGALRRLRDAAEVLDKLARDRDPRAAAILASQPWAEVAGHFKATRDRPVLSDLRLARLLHDPALEARKRSVLDDKTTRLGLELAILFDPSDALTKEDLAYLDRR